MSARARSLLKSGFQIILAKNPSRSRLVTYLNAQYRGQRAILNAARLIPKKVSPKIVTIGSKFDTCVAWQTLLEIQQLANAHGCKTFLMSGTLLGFHRNKGLLPHDHDVDIGVMANDPGFKGFIESVKSLPLHGSRVVRRRLSSKTQAMNPWIPKLPDDTLLYKLKVRDPHSGSVTEVDIFVHFQVGPDLLHGSLNTLWANSPFELNAHEIDGVIFYLPADVHRYLSENYGDYETPITDFDSHLDCPNVRNIYSTSSRRLLLRKHRFLFRLNPNHPRLERLHYRIVAMTNEVEPELNKFAVMGTISPMVPI